jgi:hypothetical protein
MKAVLVLFISTPLRKGNLLILLTKKGKLVPSWLEIAIRRDTASCFVVLNLIEVAEFISLLLII